MTALGNLQAKLLFPTVYTAKKQGLNFQGNVKHNAQRNVKEFGFIRGLMNSFYCTLLFIISEFRKSRTDKRIYYTIMTNNLTHAVL